MLAFQLFQKFEGTRWQDLVLLQKSTVLHFAFTWLIAQINIKEQKTKQCLREMFTLMRMFIVHI